MGLEGPHLHLLGPLLASCGPSLIPSIESTFSTKQVATKTKHVFRMAPSLSEPDQIGLFAALVITAYQMEPRV